MGSDELTDTIKLNFDFLKNKKFQWGIVIVLFLFIFRVESPVENKIGFIRSVVSV